MAIAFGTSTPVASNFSTTSPITFTFNNTDGNSNTILVVTGWCDNAGGWSSGDFNGQALTKLVAGGVAVDKRAEWWYLLNPPSGSHTITVNFTGSIAAVCATVYTGVGGVGNNNTGGSAGTTDLGVSITNQESTSWDVMGGRAGGGTVSAGANTTLRLTDPAGGGVYDSNGAVSSTTLHQVDDTSVAMGLAIGEIKASGAAPAQGAVSRRRMLMGIGQ